MTESELVEKIRQMTVRDFFSLAKTMTPREAHFMRLKYGLQLPPKEIADFLQVRLYRLAEIEAKVLRKFLHPKRAHYFEAEKRAEIAYVKGE
jgi:DNA-directed RNA polymerase sigma subunit (sigma70/sigma32)